MMSEIDAIKRKNEIMVTALQNIEEHKPPLVGVAVWTDYEQGFKQLQVIARRALTVSKQEESTVSEVACEQTNKDSLHVARQNIPTHPTEQINRLAAEVESDMRWREGEQK